MDIIDIPTKPEDFLGLPMNSPISLFYERINYPFDLFQLNKYKIRTFRTANIQWRYINDILDGVFIDFNFKDRFIFKFNSIEIDGNTSHSELKQIIADGKMDYIEHWFSEDQINICVNNWVLFFFHIGDEGILIDKINFPLNLDVHRGLLHNVPPKSRKWR